MKLKLGDVEMGNKASLQQNLNSFQAKALVQKERHSFDTWQSIT
jgi:hypothetical protein